jgi:hypothetical protein
MDRSQLLNDQEQATRLFLDGRQANTWTAMPGVVQSVNLALMTVEVQIAIKGEITDENENVQSVNYPLLLDVPIVFPSAGGFTLTMPITVGDEVLVIFASRCIDAWWQAGGVNNVPMEARMHDLSDAFAMPGPKSKPNVIGSISATACQLRTNDGTVYLEVSATGVKVHGNLVVTGEVTASGIPLSTHLHGGVTPGGSDTGVPIP